MGDILRTPHLTDVGETVISLLSAEFPVSLWEGRFPAWRELQDSSAVRSRQLFFAARLYYLKTNSEMLWFVMLSGALHPASDLTLFSLRGWRGAVTYSVVFLGPVPQSFDSQLHCFGLKWISRSYSTVRTQAHSEVKSRGFPRILRNFLRIFTCLVSIRIESWLFAICVLKREQWIIKARV